MRLGVSTLAIHTPGGIGRYARILAAVLLTRFEGKLHLFLQYESDLDFILRELPRPEAERFELRAGVHLHFSQAPILPRYLLHQFEIPRAFGSLKLDAYLDPDYILPPLRGVPGHCVIHDTTPYTAPHLLGLKARIIYGLSGPGALARAKGLICDSAQTKAKMAQLFPRLEPKLRTVSSCLAPKFSALAAEGYHHVNTVSVRTQQGSLVIPQPYVLHVGVAGPRKNVEALLHAFKEVKLRMLPHRLLLVGGKAVPLPKERRPIPEAAFPGGVTMNQSPPLPDVLHLGQVDDEDLVSLYRHADLLVLPSIDEGFGYPVLEALNFRTPALVTAGSPLEHLPGVASIPDVRNPLAIAASMENCLRNLNELSSELSAGFSRDEYSCEHYLREMLRAIS